LKAFVWPVATCNFMDQKVGPEENRGFSDGRLYCKILKSRKFTINQTTMGVKNRKRPGITCSLYCYKFEEEEAQADIYIMAHSIRTDRDMHVDETQGGRAGYRGENGLREDWMGLVARLAQDKYDLYKCQ